MNCPDATQPVACPDPQASPRLDGKRVLIIVENLPVPFDRRVWQQARSLCDAGAEVSVICPKGHGCDTSYEQRDGVHIYRHPLPIEARSAAGYLVEYPVALFWETMLAWKIFLTRGFDVIHACNPPDLIFLIALPFKLFGKKFIFDHHDINPELYEAKFRRKGFFWRLLCQFEKLTFRCADISIATNESYREIAIKRGGMDPQKVFVVRSGPDLSRLVSFSPVSSWRNGRAHMVGYVGVMAEQEGIDLLLDCVGYIVEKIGRSDIQFVLVGGGPSLESLKAGARSRGLEDYVTFTGRAPEEALIEVLSTMDIGVNPDRVNAMNDKSTMNKIMEYMAMAKSIVQFDVTEGRFSAGDASLYAAANDPVDLAAKIVTLIDDPERRAAMGETGRKRVVEKLGWEHQVAPLIAAYRAVFSLQSPSR